MKKEQESIERKEPSLEEVSNTINFYLRKVNCSADEHDGLRANVKHLFDKSTECDAWKSKCEEHEKTIASLNSKSILKKK